MTELAIQKIGLRFRIRCRCSLDSYRLSIDDNHQSVWAEVLAAIGRVINMLRQLSQ